MTLTTDPDHDVVRKTKQTTSLFKSCGEHNGHGRCPHHRSYRANLKRNFDGKGNLQTRDLDLVHEVCSCPCHERQPLQCLECGSENSELDDLGQCVDRQGCHDMAILRRDNHPKWQQYAKIRQVAAEAEAQARAERGDPDRPSKPKRERGPARPTSGTCHHCGAPTKGGKFVAGHDAKLKGELVREGTIDAAIETLCRDWPIKTFNAKAHESGTVGERTKRLAKAQAKFDKMSGVECEAFLAERNATRSGRHGETT